MDDGGERRPHGDVAEASAAARTPIAHEPLGTRIYRVPGARGKRMGDGENRRSLLLEAEGAKEDQAEGQDVGGGDGTDKTADPLGRRLRSLWSLARTEVRPVCAIRIHGAVCQHLSFFDDSTDIGATRPILESGRRFDNSPSPPFLPHDTPHPMLDCWLPVLPSSWRNPSPERGSSMSSRHNGMTNCS